jgi:hypothetical protein
MMKEAIIWQKQKPSGVSNSTMSGASRFQSRTVLGKNDIFLVSIREDGIWNAQKSKLHNLQYDEGSNHMAETETETETEI